METIRSYTIGEFRGPFPDIQTAPRVDIDALTSGDDDPFFITLPVARVGEVSTNGLEYDEALVQAIYEQVVSKGGILGHIPDEARATAFPIENVDWVGAQRQGNTLWAKGYIPPSEAREYIRRLKARGGKLATSIYGPGEKLPGSKPDSYRMDRFSLESLDLAPADRAALKLGGAFAVTAQMEQENEDKEPEMDKNEILAELTVKDVPQAVREQIIGDWKDTHDTETRIAELEQQNADAQSLIQELQKTIEGYKASEFDATLDARVAELVDWNVKGDEAKEKVQAFRRMVRQRIVGELGDERAADKVGDVAETVWAEMKPLAETLRDALAGPAAVVNGRALNTRKLDDSPEARQKARSMVGI